MDDESKIIDCSPRIEQFLGYTPAQVVGRPFLEFVHQQDHSSVEEVLNVTAKEGFERDHHFRMVLKRGGSLEVSMNTAIALNAEGWHGRTICMISAVKRVRSQSSAT